MKYIKRKNVKDSIFYIKKINYIYLQVKKNENLRKKIHYVPFIFGISFFHIQITKNISSFSQHFLQLQ